MNKGNDDIAIVAILLVVFISGFVFYGKVIYRKEMGVVIDDKVWTWYKAYRYTEEHTELVTKTRHNSDGTTETYTEWETHTHTYTRCANRSSGRELPESEPIMSCFKRYGDSEVNRLDYLVEYHEWEKDKKRLAHIKHKWWDDFKGDMRITIDLFGYVVKYERISQ